MGGGGTISNPFIRFITLLALEAPRLMDRPSAIMLRMTVATTVQVSAENNPSLGVR